MQYGGHISYDQDAVFHGEFREKSREQSFRYNKPSGQKFVSSQRNFRMAVYKIVQPVYLQCTKYVDRKYISHA